MGGEAGRWSEARAPTTVTQAQTLPSLVPLLSLYTETREKEPHLSVTFR